MCMLDGFSLVLEKLFGRAIRNMDVALCANIGLIVLAVFLDCLQGIVEGVRAAVNQQQGLVVVGFSTLREVSIESKPSERIILIDAPRLEQDSQAQYEGVKVKLLCCSKECLEPFQLVVRVLETNVPLIQVDAEHVSTLFIHLDIGTSLHLIHKALQPIQGCREDAIVVVSIITKVDLEQSFKAGNFLA